MCVYFFFQCSYFEIVNNIQRLAQHDLLMNELGPDLFTLVVMMRRVNRNSIGIIQKMLAFESCLCVRNLFNNDQFLLFRQKRCTDIFRVFVPMCFTSFNNVQKTLTLAERYRVKYGMISISVWWSFSEKNILSDHLFYLCSICGPLWTIYGHLKAFNCGFSFMQQPREISLGCF